VPDNFVGSNEYDPRTETLLLKNAEIVMCRRYWILMFVPLVMTSFPVLLIVTGSDYNDVGFDYSLLASNMELN
jgi:hypothetical protein